MELQFEKRKIRNNRQIYTCGVPDYQGLTKVEKRVLLLPLVEVIRDFYKDPENRATFEKWKSEDCSNRYA